MIRHAFAAILAGLPMGALAQNAAPVQPSEAFVLPVRMAEPTAFTPCPFNPAEPFRLAVMNGVAGPDALRTEQFFVLTQIRACRS